MSFLKALLGGKTPSSDPNFFQRATTSTPKRRDSACSSGSWESPQSSSAASQDGYSWHCTLTNTMKHSKVNPVEEVDESRDYSKYPYTRPGVPLEIFIDDRRMATLQRIWDDSVWDYYYKPKDPDDRPDRELHITHQTTDIGNPSWAFRYDFEKWIEYYKVNQVVLQNFFCFLDYESSKMEYVPLIRKKDKVNGSGASGNMLTPPYSGQNGPGGSSPNSQAELSSYSLTHPTGHNYVPMDQFTTFDEENMDVMISLSGGRLERLAKLLSQVSFEKLIFNSADKTMFQRRPTLMFFWLLKLLPDTVCSLQLDNIVAEVPIDLAEVLPQFFGRLWDISITLAKDRSAFIANEDILMKWLETPIPKKKRSRFYFANCDIDIISLLRFIKGWRVTPEPHLFDNVTIGRGSIPAMEFCKCIEDESWPFQHDWEVPYKHNYLGSKKTPWQDRQYIWQHKKSPAVLHYRFREGMLIFTAHMDHIEMLERCCTREELASVKRTCAMNPNDPHTLPYCAPHMTPLINLTDDDIEKGRTANYFYYRSTA